MKIDSRPLRILLALFVSGVFVFVSCTSTIESEPEESKTAAVNENTSTDSEGPPPLVVDMDTPLLLDEPSEEEIAVANTEAAVENTACFVCHANYMNESLTNNHTKMNIGCVQCHGESTAHRNDENNTTPPEIMYPAEKINPYCQGCHSTAHDTPPKTIIGRWLEDGDMQIDESSVAIIARWEEHGYDKTTTDPEKIVCTDCHGDHRLRIRTVIWDKKSGKLLSTNRGE